MINIINDLRVLALTLSLVSAEMIFTWFNHIYYPEIKSPAHLYTCNLLCLGKDDIIPALLKIYVFTMGNV